MSDIEKKDLLATSWKLHDLIEKDYLAHPATKGDKYWLEKQRLLLADMAIHLLQTSMKPGEIELDKLKNNLYSILTIGEQFIPQSNLKQAADSLYKEIS